MNGLNPYAQSGAGIANFQQMLQQLLQTPPQQRSQIAPNMGMYGSGMQRRGMTPPPQFRAPTQAGMGRMAPNPGMKQPNMGMQGTSPQSFGPPGGYNPYQQTPTRDIFDNR